MRFYLLATAATIAVAGLQAQDQQPVLPPVKHKTVVIARQGDQVHFPGNTIEAYQSAIRAGVDYIEAALRTTADSGQVILYDRSVESTTNGHGAVAALTFDKVKALTIDDDIHHKKYHVPSFKEVLLACRGKVNVYLDFKDADVNMTWRMIKALHMENNVVVRIGTQDQFREWQRLAPEMPLAGSLPDSVKDAASLNAFLDEYPLSVIDGAAGRYTPDMLAALKLRGVAVWLDVQSGNEGPVAWAQLLDNGVPGIQTNDPVGLTQYLTKQHTR